MYLSGTNAAWINYGADFGDNAWQDHGDTWRQELDQVTSHHPPFVVYSWHLAQNIEGPTDQATPNWTKWEHFVKVIFVSC